MTIQTMRDSLNEVVEGLVVLKQIYKRLTDPSIGDDPSVGQEERRRRWGVMQDTGRECRQKWKELQEPLHDLWSKKTSHQFDQLALIKTVGVYLDDTKRAINLFERIIEKAIEDTAPSDRPRVMPSEIAIERSRWLDGKQAGKFSDVDLARTKKVSYGSIVNYREGHNVLAKTRRGIAEGLCELGISCEFSEVPK